MTYIGKGDLKWAPANPTIEDLTAALAKAIILAGVPDANKDEVWADELAKCALALET